jgi:hypothetical protein
MCELENIRFWVMFFTFGSLFLMAVNRAWTRHGATEDEQWRQLLRDPGKRGFIQRFGLKLGINQTVSIVDDLLTPTEKARVHSIIVKGLPLSSRNAEAAGFTRVTWNRTRVNLVNMGLAEYKDKGGIVARARLAEYVQPLPRPGDTPQFVRNMADNTPQHAHNKRWGRGA